jgi:hypothetical protein
VLPKLPKPLLSFFLLTTMIICSREDDSSFVDTTGFLDGTRARALGDETKNRLGIVVVVIKMRFVLTQQESRREKKRKNQKSKRRRRRRRRRLQKKNCHGVANDTLEISLQKNWTNRKRVTPVLRRRRKRLDYFFKLRPGKKKILFYISYYVTYLFLNSHAHNLFVCLFV